MPNIPNFATADPFDGMSEAEPCRAKNLLSGKWVGEDNIDNIMDPLTGKNFLQIPNTNHHDRFIDNLRSCPKYGLHNPFSNVDRYVMLGRVCTRAASMLADKNIENYFTTLIQRMIPKNKEQCRGEVIVTRIFLENFSGDRVRFLGRGFSNPGDHIGQESRGYRWPYGPVVIISPFNFPLEIPALQTMGALFMGNRPLIKADSKVGIVIEQFIRMLIECGLPSQDIDLIHCRGSEMGKLLAAAKDHIRLVQFTGSSEVADEISSLVDGAVRIEDAGFDWKIIGPDYQPKWLDYVAWQSDQDAYNATGQKCSAQSLLLIHKNWSKALLPKIKDLASQRKLDNLTIGPVLSLTNSEMLSHVNSLLEIKGTKLLFGGNEITGHSIPECYGIIEPTAIQVPLEAFDSEYFDLITKELFGPFQIVVEYEDENLEIVLEIIERISNHLTAAIVSQDIQFQQHVIGASVNGTTYCGMRARTTGAPQNHWFGPSGDPRAAGIGTPEAIIATWSCHREIIMDQGPLPNDWSPQ